MSDSKLSGINGIVIIEPVCKKITKRDKFDRFCGHLEQLGYHVLTGIPSTKELKDTQEKLNLTSRSTTMMFHTKGMQHLSDLCVGKLSYCSHVKAQANLIIQVPDPEAMIPSLIPNATERLKYESYFYKQSK